ncbi:MAG TPA: hypothetical protein VL651_09090 [Bacteroidia bacterium]|jgi:hypothetical protein|nr:hypothetical protein [Bacteroidia bacterium]
MRKLFKSSVSILLAIFIFVSGSGFVIGRMMCMHSGYTLYSLSEAKDCCAPSKGISIKGNCCAITNAFIKTDKFVSQSRVDIPQDFSFVGFSSPSFQIPAYKYEAPNSSLRAPPLRSENELLHFISVQRV